MEIADRQQVGLAGSQPLARGGTLAFGAMPVATAVVGDATVTAVLAAFDVAAEGCRAAGLNRRHDLELGETDVTGMGRPPDGAVTTEDVGDLQRGSHRGQPLGRAPWAMRAMILSSGLVTVRTVLVATRA